MLVLEWKINIFKFFLLPKLQKKLCLSYTKNLKSYLTEFFKIIFLPQFLRNKTIETNMTFCMILYCNSENLSLLGVARQFLQMFSKFAQILQTFWTGKLANNYEFLEFESLYCRMSFLVWIEKFEVWDIFISFTRTSWYSEKKR